MYTLNCHVGQNEGSSKLQFALWCPRSPLTDAVTGWPHVPLLVWWQPQAWRPSLSSLRLIFFSPQGRFLGTPWSDSGVLAFLASGQLTSSVLEISS